MQTFPTYGDVTARVRSLLDDQPGKIYTDTFVLPLVNQALGILHSELVSAGVSELRLVTLYTSGSANGVIPAGTTRIDIYKPPVDPGIPGLPPPNVLVVGPTLPTNIIAPIRLMERRVGGNAAEWLMMRGAKPLPTTMPSRTLVAWDWFDEAIHLVGATEDRELFLEYWARPEFFSSPADATTFLPLIDATEILAALTAGLAAQSRGQAQLAQNFGAVQPDGVTGMAGRLIYNYINTQTKTTQSEPLRRLPYANILRYPNVSYPTGWGYR